MINSFRRFDGNLTFVNSYDGSPKILEMPLCGNGDYYFHFTPEAIIGESVSFEIPATDHFFPTFENLFISLKEAYLSTEKFCASNCTAHDAYVEHFSEIGVPEFWNEQKNEITMECDDADCIEPNKPNILRIQSEKDKIVLKFEHRNLATRSFRIRTARSAYQSFIRYFSKFREDIEMDAMTRTITYSDNPTTIAEKGLIIPTDANLLWLLNQKKLTAQEAFESYITHPLQNGKRQCSLYGDLNGAFTFTNIASIYQLLSPFTISDFVLEKNAPGRSYLYKSSEAPGEKLSRILLAAKKRLSDNCELASLETYDLFHKSSTILACSNGSGFYFSALELYYLAQFLTPEADIYLSKSQPILYGESDQGRAYIMGYHKFS